jgi:anhydro-N-acetylmuramic acid kinase
MSGTSMDGIDAALLRTNGEQELSDLGQLSLEYDHEFKILLKVAEKAVKSCLGDIRKANENLLDVLDRYLVEVLQLGNESQRTAKSQHLLNYLNDFLSVEEFLSPLPLITLPRIIERSTCLHILAVQKLLAKCNLSASEVALIGYHGQTLYHAAASQVSVIVGDCQRMANALGIPVVGNFRANDVRSGGQGAPFAPLYHQALARRDAMQSLAVVNCGGIANITVISGGEVYAFDTGPGNGLLDNFVRYGCVCVNLF